MADLDVNAVALNLTNTLSPEANVRRQGNVGFMSPLNLRFYLYFYRLSCLKGSIAYSKQTGIFVSILCTSLGTRIDGNGLR